MKDNILIWNSKICYDIMLGRYFEIGLFKDAEIVNCFQLTDTVATDPRFKIAIMYTWETTKIDLSSFDLVVAFNVEVSDNNEKFLQSLRVLYSNNNVIMVQGGLQHDVEFTSPNIHFPYFGFAAMVVMANEQYGPQDIDFTSPREFKFDVLLGGVKHHRIFVFNKLVHENMMNDSLVSIRPGPYDHFYTNIWNDLDFIEPRPTPYKSPRLIELEEEAIQEYQVGWSGYAQENVSLKGPRGYNPTMSSVMPKTMYRHTWFSIVTETQYADHKFATEKTFKIFFAKRIAVFFAPLGHLKMLRERGFKTFHGIIDESYDNEIDNRRRANMAWEQVRFLHHCDPVALYARARPILEYNALVLQDLPRIQLEEMSNFILSHVNKLR